MNIIRGLHLYNNSLFRNFIKVIIDIALSKKSIKTRLLYELLEETKKPITRVRPKAVSRIRSFPIIKISGPLNRFASGITLPWHPTPRVSVIIPVYNQLAYTLCCLASISRTPPAAHCEIIVVDDCSNDETANILPQVKGLTIIRNVENLNFLKSANIGASQAKGEYIMFLNNDTQVHKGWLDALLEVFDQYEDAGLVGSKIVFPTGHLQEAGARVKVDGSIVMIGLNENPGLAQYNYLREVDYCSGVSIMLKSKLFKELNGFDNYFAPCYYEDADLAYRVKAKGGRIYYQPNSVICHHLSVSTATHDNNQKMINLNRGKKKFLQRWHEQIQLNHQLRLIAFYLPQFHTIPENDEWWGKGFTEWTNVRKAQPNFKGHYQPKVPGQLGYYDLRDDNIRKQQIDLAQKYGISAFCYYYYWFNGQKLLETPLEMLSANKSLDFPFCICWANENWTRTWDGGSDCVLLEQKYSINAYQEFIKDIYPLLIDERYLKVGNKPILLIYRVSRIHDCRQALNLWRSYCRDQGGFDLYMVSVDSFGEALRDNHYELGFDALVEFPPHPLGKPLKANLKFTNPRFSGKFFDYIRNMENFLRRPLPAGKFFRCAMPSWDNTARRQDTPDTFVNATPTEYEKWLTANIEYTHNFLYGEEKISFINAWNEWGEGNYLEPDGVLGYSFLEATKKAVLNSKDIPVQ